jgi:hypothetical protein
MLTQDDAPGHSQEQGTNRPGAAGREGVLEDVGSDGKGEDDAGATLTSKGDGPLQLLGQCAD